MSPVSRRACCRLCQSTRIERVMCLDPIPLSEIYTETQAEAHAADRFPIDLYMCADCGHVQHIDVIDPSVLWKNYKYFSGDAKGMPEHFAETAERILAETPAAPGALVIDIGGNDGSLLREFQKRGFRVLNVDPAEEAAARAEKAGVPTIVDVWDERLAAQVLADYGPAAIICAFNVFAHADDLSGFTRGAAACLEPDGAFYFEAQYLVDIIDKTLIASLFHEHMSHHSVGPLVPFFERAGLELRRIRRAPIQHGSIIGAAMRQEAPGAIDTSVAELLALEESMALRDPAAIRAFAANVADIRQRVTNHLRQARAAGMSVAGFGAARSGPTLMAQLGLRGLLDFVVDDHPGKIGRYESGDGLFVRPTADLSAEAPDIVVILAWVHTQRIIDGGADFLAKGGAFIGLFPHVRLVTAEGETPL